MKTALRITLSFLLSVTILLSGSSFTFGKMVCLETGQTFIDYKKVENCCDKHRPAPVVVRENCCEITNVDLTVDNFLASNTPLVKMEATPALFLAGVNYYNVNFGYIQKQVSAYEQPPPEKATDILIKIQNYRI